jgi:hypothetical protein|nr:MAG TPA: tail protein [Caudoviricetes sp.]
MIQIKRNNKVFFTLEDFGEGSKLSYQLMDHHYTILKFTTATPVYFEIGDSVEIPDFGYFELTSAYFPKHNDSDGYDYEMQMDAYYMAWKNKLCKYRPQHGANETSFKLTATVGVHMNVILGNLKALGLTYNGKEFSVDYTTYNNKAFDVQKRFLIEYGSISIIDALNDICSEDALNCEWWIDGSIIYLGYCEMKGQTTFEQNVNVLSMSCSESKSTYITRLYAFGSDRNIPKGYFTGADADVTTDGIATDYLMLPNKGVDSDGFYAKDGYLENVNVVKSDKQAIEGVVMFEDEYPKVEIVVSSIKTYDSTVDNDDGTKTTQTFWQVTATDSFATSFEPSWIKRNLTLGIKFTSGALMGMEFDVSFKVIDKVNYFEIVANDTYGRTLPDGVMCPKVGDKFFLFNWDATKITNTDLIPKARLSLFNRAKQYYQKTMISNSNFTCTMDGEKFYNDGTYDYHPIGEQVKLINDIFAQVDADGKHYRNSRIIGMEIPLDIPYDHPQYTVGEKAATSRLGKLEDKVDSITVNGMQIGGTESGNGGGVYVIGLNDTTPETDSNVYSARRIRNNFLSKTKDDVAQGIIRFVKGLNFGAKAADNHLGISSAGIATLKEIVSAAFRSGALGSGFKLGDYNGSGDSYLEVDRLLVRKAAEFVRLVIRELQSVGGEIVLSPAAMKISNVVYFEKGTVLPEYDGSPLRYDVYRCYFSQKKGDEEIENQFVMGDLVRCQTFNVKEGVSENVKNRYYWRKVYKVGKDFIDLLADDCDTGSDVPQAGDELVQMGNVYETARQSVVVLSAYGADAPSFKMYYGVDSYSLENKEVFVLSRKEMFAIANKFKFVTRNANGEIKSTQSFAELVMSVDGLKSTVNNNKSEVDGQISKISSQITQTAGKITTLTKEQTAMGNKISKIEQSTEKISLQVETTTNLKNCIVGSALRPWDDIVKIAAGLSQAVNIINGGGVGGSNYAVFNAQGATANTWTGLYFKDVRVTPGKKYIFSVWTKVIRATDSGAYYTIKRFDNGVAGAVVESKNYPNIVGDWALYTSQITVPSGCSRLLIETAIRKNGTINLCRLMLMEGTEYGGWSLSPYDKTEAGKLETDLKSTGIDIENGKITATADKFEIRNNSGETTASVNEKGLLEVGAGLFGGFVKKKKTIITPENIDQYRIPAASLSVVLFDFTNTGSFVEFQGDFNNYFKTSQVDLVLPFNNPKDSLNSLHGVSTDEALQYVGQTLIIKNRANVAFVVHGGGIINKRGTTTSTGVLKVNEISPNERLITTCEVTTTFGNSTSNGPNRLTAVGWNGNIYG